MAGTCDHVAASVKLCNTITVRLVNTSLARRFLALFSNGKLCAIAVFRAARSLIAQLISNVCQTLFAVNGSARSPIVRQLPVDECPSNLAMYPESNSQTAPKFVTFLKEQLMSEICFCNYMPPDHYQLRQLGRKSTNVFVTASY